jgi:hypothetical protein
MQQVQQAISKRELETPNGSQEHQTERQRFKEIDSIMAPRREKHARRERAAAVILWMTLIGVTA